MIAVIVPIVIILISFSFVIFFGAPYLPTLSLQIDTALDLIDLKPEDTLLELGCGDGRVLIAAAKRGINCIAYEINPILLVISWLRTRRYKKLIKLRWGNFWVVKWPEADAIFVFLLEKYMEKLDKKCIQYDHKPVKLVSFAFPVKSKKPDKLHNGVFMYLYK